MNTATASHRTLHGIKSVNWCLTSQLTIESPYNEYADKAVRILNQLTELPCIVQSKCSLNTEESVENGLHKWQTTLTILTGQTPELPHENLSFVVETVSGDKYLLGSTIRPKATYTMKRTVDGNASGNTGTTLTVSLTQAHDLLPVF